MTATPTAVHPPVTRTKLGYYSHQKGIFIIRSQGKVIYIGESTNIFNAVRRLYHKGGALGDLTPNNCNFEAIITTKKRGPLVATLRRYFEPPRNRAKLSSINRLNRCQRNQADYFLKYYLKNSHLEIQGEAQSDHNNPK